MNTITSHDAQSTRGKLISWISGKQESLLAVMMLVFITLFSSLTLTKPTYEWDLLPYMANAMQIVDEQPIDVLHTNVYEAAVKALPTHAYSSLLGSPSRFVLSEDSEAFRQTMTFFYDARIVYNYIMAGMLASGLNPVFAYYFFSTLCAVISLLLLMRLIPAKLPVAMHFVMPFIVLAFGLMTVARLATPDALAALTTISLYFILLRNKLLLLLILLPLVVFIRTDLILLIGLFHAYLLFGNRVSKVLVVISGLATIFAYLYLNHVIVEGDPWSSLLGYNFGEKPTHPADYHYPVPVSQYLEILNIGIYSFSYIPIFFAFCMLTVMGVVILASRYFSQTANLKFSVQHLDLLFVILSSAVYFLLHFLLFPVGWTRFFAAQYSLVAVVVCWCFFSIHAAREKSTAEMLDFLKAK